MSRRFAHGRPIFWGAATLRRAVTVVYLLDSTSSSHRPRFHQPPVTTRVSHGDRGLQCGGVRLRVDRTKKTKQNVRESFSVINRTSLSGTRVKPVRACNRVCIIVYYFNFHCCYCFFYYDNTVCNIHIKCITVTTVIRPLYNEYNITTSIKIIGK